MSRSPAAKPSTPGQPAKLSDLQAMITQAQVAPAQQASRPASQAGTQRLPQPASQGSPQSSNHQHSVTSPARNGPPSTQATTEPSRRSWEQQHPHVYRSPMRQVTGDSRQGSPGPLIGPRFTDRSQRSATAAAVHNMPIRTSEVLRRFAHRAMHPTPGGQRERMLEALSRAAGRKP